MMNRMAQQGIGSIAKSPLQKGMDMGMRAGIGGVRRFQQGQMPGAPMPPQMAPRPPMPMQSAPRPPMPPQAAPRPPMPPQRPPMDQGVGSLGRSTQMNEKELVNAAIKAIQNPSPQSKGILRMFVQQFGEAALQKLIQAVQSGEIGANAQNEGQIAGAGDGMDDLVPANLEGQEDVLLSKDEYIVPADVVSSLGNGSSDAGAASLDTMVDTVRTAKYGRRVQPPQINPSDFLPA